VELRGGICRINTFFSVLEPDAFFIKPKSYQPPLIFSASGSHTLPSCNESTSYKPLKNLKKCNYAV
jgi:hypothetical protein